MRREQLKVTVKPSGEVHVEVVHGPGGVGCLNLIRPVQEALGVETEQVDLPEMHEQAVENEHEEVGY